MASYSYREFKAGDDNGASARWSCPTTTTSARPPRGRDGGRRGQRGA